MAIIYDAYSKLGRALPAARAHDTRAIALLRAMYARVSTGDSVEHVGRHSHTTFHSTYLRNVPIKGVRESVTSSGGATGWYLFHLYHTHNKRKYLEYFKVSAEP